MTPLQNLTVEQLRQLVAIKEQIESLQGEIESITGGSPPPASQYPKRRGRKKMSRSAAARIAVAARWAKVRAAKAAGAPEKRWKVSAATKARMSAAAKARWATAKGKKQF